MRISDWSSDVCSSDLIEQQAQYLVGEKGVGCRNLRAPAGIRLQPPVDLGAPLVQRLLQNLRGPLASYRGVAIVAKLDQRIGKVAPIDDRAAMRNGFETPRSEEHTSELQSLMRISYAVFCLKKKNNTSKQQYT